MTSRVELTCVVPTAGRSPHLSDCIQALTSDPGTKILVIAEEGLAIPSLAGRRDLRVLTVPPKAGFARACNRALAEARSEFVALVNDDALVAPDWCRAIVSALQMDPDLAAAQGTIVQLEDSNTIDGCGIGWNRHWQAIQLDRGASPDITAPIRDVFGVSGTAAIYRRSALQLAALPGGGCFDPLLGTYYEDVELACRLRSHGFRSACVPNALTRHGGSSSSIGAERWRWTHIYGNRLLVLARLWGRTFPLHLPALLLRDSVDLVRAAARIDHDLFLGIIAGWGRAVRRFPHFSHLGPPMLPMQELSRYRVDTRKGQNRS